MKNLTCPLVLSALLAAPTWAQNSTTPSKRPDVDKVDDQNSIGVDTTPPGVVGPPTHVFSKRLTKTDDHGAIGAGEDEPVIIIDDGWPNSAGFMKEIDAAGEYMLRMADAGLDGGLEPFKQALHNWQVDRARRAARFGDLDDVEPPILEAYYARDLWARAIDVSIDKELGDLQAAGASGKPTGAFFARLRACLEHRAGVLGDTGASLARLRAFLTDAQGCGGALTPGLYAFKVELERQRMQQAFGVAQKRKSADGVVQLSDRLRLARIWCRVRDMGVVRGELIVYPVG